MTNNGPFGFDPEDIDRVVREAGESLRGVFGKFTDQPVNNVPWMSVFNEFVKSSAPQDKPKTSGDAGAGVWAIYIVDGDGGAHVEQVFPDEIEALRANKSNTDPKRQVRFLPYGVTVGILDVEQDDKGDKDTGE